MQYLHLLNRREAEMHNEETQEQVESNSHTIQDVRLNGFSMFLLISLVVYVLVFGVSILEKLGDISSDIQSNTEATQNYGHTIENQNDILSDQTEYLRAIACRLYPDRTLEVTPTTFVDEPAPPANPMPKPNAYTTTYYSKFKSWRTLFSEYFTRRKLWIQASTIPL